MRKRPRQRRARESVEAILEATRQLLTEGPIESFSTDAIAERAGVSVGTLYQYFEDKADLVREVGERHVREVGALLASVAAPDASDGSLRRYAVALLEATAEGHARDRGLHATILGLGLTSSLRRTLERSEARARESLARVAEAQGAADPAMAAGLAYDLIERFAHKRLAEPGDTVPESVVERYADELARLLAGET
ncbi:MAG: helix-turn-helix domain-containing protein [Myxococcota bacterium]|nr:helix-turn-helix domain-containing protein [Myxococcota bacterium]